MGKHVRFGRVGIGVMALIAAAIAAPAWAYEYDEDDPTQGAGAEASWRVLAQWDDIDEESTREIHVHTTEARYISPMVSFIPQHPTVPSPRDVLGYIAGTEDVLTRPEDTIRYFQALADTSPNVTLLQIGTTEEGRPMHIAVITDAANMARLEEYKGYTNALADPRNLNDDEARAIIEKAKPIMHVTAGLHSPETGPPEMVMELAYRLAVSKHPDIEAIRENVILVITPVTDVDGRAKVVDWYYRYLKDYETRQYMPSMSPPYWGKYAYHDNNRDGIQMALRLTQAYMRMFLEWHPTYSIDLHESVALLYVSGGTGPYNPNIDPITVREWQWFAHYELEELQRHNMPGVWTWGYYTGWNPSYLLWITNNHNSMGRFYETFGNSTAHTMERDLRNSTFAGRKIPERTWYRADPPDEKVMWSMRNNTNYMQSGVLASLKLLSKNGATLLENFYQKGKNSMREGTQKAPYAWVIPAEQRDPSRLAYLINQLQRHAVEVHRATADFEVDEGEFKAGDFVVRLDQPYGRHARNLLARIEFPVDAEHRPYDDVSWTFGLIYRVDTTPIEDKSILEMGDIAKVEDFVSFPGTVGGEDPKAYGLKNTGSNAQITARYALKKYKISAIEEEFEVDGVTYPVGSWIVPHRRGLKGVLTKVAEESMLTFEALDEIPEVPMHNLDLPRIALYHNWVSTQADGWVRLALEQAGVPFEYIADYTIKQGGLNSKYDVILMAHQGRANGKAMVHGRDPKFGAQSYRKTSEFPSHGYVDGASDITRGMGFQGLARLEEFLNRGGTLLLMGSAGSLATEMGLVRNVSTSRTPVSTPGSALQTKVLRPDHPIAYGFEEVNHVFRINGPLYTVPERFDHWVVMKYGTDPLRKDEDEDDDSDSDDADEAPDDKADDAEEEEETKSKKKPGKFLLSGYADKQDQLKKMAAIIDIPRNDGGRVILYSFNPMHRFLNHGDHNYVFNALLNWNDFPDPQPKDHEGLVKD